MELNGHEQEEVRFWENLRKEKGDGFEAFRLAELQDKTEHFPSFSTQTGFGLDLGSGLLSVLELSGKEFIAIDPLMDEFNNIFPLDNRRVGYAKQTNVNKIDFADGLFDWVFCVNVIDHTAEPKLLIEEVARVLKPGGTFYFEVNFDDHLSPAHYGLWTEDTVNSLLNSRTELFTKINDVTVRNTHYPQSLYWAEYKRV